MLALLLLAFLPFQGAEKPRPSELGPRVGERLPELSLPDQHGARRELRSLAGPAGLVLVFFRSADW